MSRSKMGITPRVRATDFTVRGREISVALTVFAHTGTVQHVKAGIFSPNQAVILENLTGKQEILPITSINRQKSDAPCLR